MPINWQIAPSKPYKIRKIGNLWRLIKITHGMNSWWEDEIAVKAKFDDPWHYTHCCHY